MVFPIVDSHDEEIKEFVKRISTICVSDDFHLLRKELEKIYAKSGLENAALTAFQDALFTILAENNETSPNSNRGF